MEKIKGNALVTALFITSLVAIAAIAMTTRLQLDIYRTRLTINSDKLYLASQAVIFWAMSELAKKNHFTRSDGEGQLGKFPQKLLNIYPFITINGNLYDLQNRFNLNNLSDANYQISFLQFLKKLPLKLNRLHRENLLLAMQSWLRPFQLGHGEDELTSYYLQQKPPYLQSHQSMQAVSEFRLIKGVDAKRYRIFSPYLAALPDITPINVNTAPKELLMSLGNGLSEAQAEKLLKARGKKGFRDINKLNQLAEKLNIKATQITLESQYFLVIARATSEQVNLINYAVLKRSKNGEGKIAVRIVHQSINTPE